MSTQKEVEVSYDVSNDFFALWLDRAMNYTCALFEDTEDLEQAQQNKLRWLCRAAKVAPDKNVLDIGCGWGACLDYLEQTEKVRNATGITLSTAQHDYVQNRGLKCVDTHCVDYRDYEPEARFDAVISICMMEHIATPEQVRAGEHLGLYRDYFSRAHRWTKPGAWFGLQTILRDRVPRDLADLRDVGWVTQQIFPGGLSLRLEDVIRSVGPWWEIMEIKTRREHYAKTTAEWLRRLRLNESEVRSRWGDQVFEDYERYLDTCVRSFDKHYQSLAQYALRRID
jgi:cyclopropane-fatty-acyl-phospholipid synthase